jgi:hypothetical protein
VTANEISRPERVLLNLHNRETTAARAVAQVG